MLSTAFVFWFLNSFSRRLLDDPDHGLLPALPVRRLRDLLPRVVPDAAAQHRHVVLLQRRPLLAAIGPYTLGYLTSRVFSGYHEPMRYAGVTMCAIFLLGLVVLPFAPETKGNRCRSDDAPRGEMTMTATTPDWLEPARCPAPGEQGRPIVAGLSRARAAVPAPGRAGEGTIRLRITQTINGRARRRRRPIRRSRRRSTADSTNGGRRWVGDAKPDFRSGIDRRCVLFGDARGW